MSRETVLPGHGAQRLRNLVHSALLVLGMALIAAACAWILFGPDGVLWTAVAVGVAALLTPSIAPDFVLSLRGARPIERREFPRGYALLDELARRAGLSETPRLFHLPSALLNAFTVGNPRDAAIAVSDGMFRHLSRRELTGVLAHEISHVAGRDLRIMALADIAAQFTTVLSYAGMFMLVLNLPLIAAGAVVVPWPLVFVLVLAPTLMNLLQLALSRAREFDADLSAARLTGDPEGLASALVKLERRQGGFWERLMVPGGRVLQPSLLRTHPETKERVRRLLELRETEPRPSPRLEPEAVLPEHIEIIRRPPRWHWPGVWY